MPSPERQEVELKYVLPDAAALKSLARLAGNEPGATVSQTNHFFDTATLRLRHHKLVLRLRDEEGRFFLTAKGPSEPGSSAFLSRKEEAEVELEEAVSRALLEGRIRPLDVLEQSAAREENPTLLRSLSEAAGPEPLRVVGNFLNRRTRVRWDVKGVSMPLMLELDETRFPGNRVDYEVECEVPAGAEPEPVQRQLEELLRKLGVTPAAALAKARRFFALLEPPPASAEP